MDAQTEAKAQGSMSYTVIRCGCADPMSHVRRGEACPTPRIVEPTVTQEFAPRE